MGARRPRAHRAGRPIGAACRHLGLHQLAHLADELADLHATQVALSPAQRDTPQHAGSGRHRLPTSAQAQAVLHTVVKLYTEFPRDKCQRSRIQLLTVCAPQIERNPQYHPPMRDAVAALDFARLAALLN